MRCRFIPVLMYHSVKDSAEDASTVTIEQLEDQFRYIKRKRYTSLFFDEIKNEEFIKGKSIIFTFDDAYLNNYQNLIPLLDKYQIKATVMVPTGYIGQKAGWYDTTERLMTIKQLLEIANNPLIKIGMHTHLHINLRQSSIISIEKDLKESLSFFKESKIPFEPILAYPFGAFPRRRKNSEKHAQFIDLLKRLGITHGIRIGNRLNRIPFKNMYEIKRVDVKGTDSFRVFKIKLMLGFINPF